MKIAVDCRMITMSGIGVYLSEILRELVTDKSKTFLLIGNKDHLKYYAKLKNCSLIECNSSIFSFEELFMFPTSRVNKCDVFYTPNYNIPFGIKIPIFSTIHDVVSLDLNDLTNCVGRFIRRLYIKRALCVSYKIFTVSKFSQDRIVYHFSHTDKTKIIIVYNGISKDLMQYSGIKDTNVEDYFIFVGNIKKHKGLDILIKAMDQYVQLNPKCKLVIVGNSDNFKTKDPNFSNLISNKEYIEYTGRLTNSELFNRIFNAKALIQPSRYEGFGIPPLEALYLNTNVVISDIRVFKEIYDELPVKFFKTNDSDDLLRVLSMEKYSIQNDCKMAIAERYSYRLSANKIMQAILSCIDTINPQ